ncbi:hypothetical protein AYO43_08615 [Nitrospira sp. SCGC AG-212-E16]|nr:hypothetical protein AYO43_08615 [Nitrospira sp. SCGC AG-212-E16]
MSYKAIYLLLEGDDDKRFADSVIVPRLEHTYQEVKIVKYAQMKNEKFVAYITSIRGMGAEYIILADIDGEPCVTRKKQRIVQTYKSAEIEKVIVVRREIESWYLAGLNAETCKKLKVTLGNDTEVIAKEHFDELIPRAFLNRTDFLVEILRCYAVSSALTKSKSFQYMCSRLGIV